MTDRRNVRPTLGRAIRYKWTAGVVLVIVVVAARPLFAADLSGTWDVSCRVGPDLEVLTLEVDQRGSGISGVGTMRMSSTGEAVHVEVRSGTVRGLDFRFFVVVDGGDARPQEFTGDWHGDEMSGLTQGDFGGRMFNGARRRSSG